MVSEIDRNTLIFQELGLTRVEGRILYILLAGNPYCITSIKKSTRMRQPEISIGVKRLIDRGWIQEGQQNIGRGRPQNFYKLCVPASQILTELRDNAQMECGKKEKHLNELEELLKVK